MTDLLKINKLWEEIQKKEEELSIIMQSLERKEIKYRGNTGYIHSIDPANEMALIVFLEGGTESIHFGTFIDY